MNALFATGLTLLRRIAAAALLRRLTAAMARVGRLQAPASEGSDASASKNEPGGSGRTQQ